MMNIDNKLQSMADGGEAPKRSAEDGGCQNYKRARGGSGSNADGIELRILIQSTRAGAVIGKGGDTIKRLRSEFNASVGVPDCSGPERILTIKADLDNAIGCLSQCIPLLMDKMVEEVPGVRLLVHQSHAGAIIGRVGFKIKELRTKTGATIKVFTEICPNSSERVVNVSGTPDVITNAVRAILELIQDVPIKGFNQKYDPFCFEQYMAHEYGGFTFEQRFEGNRGGGRRGGSGGGGGGRGGGGFRRGGGGGGGRMDTFSPMGGGRDFGSGSGGGGFFREEGGFNRGSFGGGRGRGGDGGGRMDRGGGNRRNFSEDSFGTASGGFSQQVEPTILQGTSFGTTGSDSGEIQTSQVTIPKELAGSIIGTCGNRIREIRNGCKAKIKIEEPVEGSSERIITITGTHTQIENAQWLLQSSVRKYSGQFF